MDDPYKTLGLERTASPEDIRKAYRKLAVQHHPDKGGDQEKFKEISAAYEILSDEQKKANYDQFGNAEGPHMGAGGMPDMGEFIRNMFGQQSHGMRRANDIQHILEISLEDAFRGVTKKLKINLDHPCYSCQQNCTGCNGQGFTVMKMGPFGFGMQRQCPICDGVGVMSKGCPACNFKQIVQQSDIVQFNISKGVQSGENIVLNGKGEQPRKQGEIPGNLIVVIKVKHHQFFQREGNHLVFTTKISFDDSVKGTTVTVPHFAGDMNIDTSYFGIIDPRLKYEIRGKGMTPDAHLYIIFDVQYPGRRVSS